MLVEYFLIPPGDIISFLSWWKLNYSTRMGYLSPGDDLFPESRCKYVYSLILCQTQRWIVISHAIHDLIVWKSKGNALFNTGWFMNFFNMCSYIINARVFTMFEILLSLVCTKLSLCWYYFLRTLEVFRSIVMELEKIVFLNIQWKASKKCAPISQQRF